MKLYSLKKAHNKTNNIIYNSPHSGENFPEEFLKSVKSSLHTLKTSGDSFVDQLFEDAQNNGSVLIANQYGRSFIDTNREAYELDPTMFSGEITKPLSDESQKVKLGYGSIAKYSYTREDIYNDKIPFNEAVNRLEQYYFPIHQTLEQLLNEQFDKFGYSLLIDCHSMPSYGFIGRKKEAFDQADIILGDRHSKSCNGKLTDYITQHFQNHDLSVSHNIPFAGGYNTDHYSDVRNNKHAIQIEIKKSLYMNEKKRCPNKFFKPFKKIIDELTYHLDQDIPQLL